MPSGVGTLHSTGSPMWTVAAGLALAAERMLNTPGVDPWHGFRVSGFGAPAGGGFWVSDLPQRLGFGFRVLGTAGGQILESELSKNREISSWSEAKLQLPFIFAKKNTGRTPSHLWYFGQRCCFGVTSPIFFRLQH